MKDSATNMLFLYLDCHFSR